MTKPATPKPASGANSPSPKAATTPSGARRSNFAAASAGKLPIGDVSEKKKSSSALMKIALPILVVGLAGAVWYWRSTTKQ